MKADHRALDGSLRRVFWLIAAVVVVLAFLGVNVIAEQQARDIDRLAYELETNAVPSINRLTVARGALQRATFAARDLVRAAAAGEPLDLLPYEGARERLNANMAEYAELPAYRREAALNQLAAKELGVYEKVVEAIANRLRAKDVAGAGALVDSDLTLANDRVDNRLQELVELNAGEIGRASEAIRSARERATRLSYALHGLAASLAVLALWAVARSNRTYEKLVETRARLESERTEVAERRAAELDMFAARVAHDLKNPLGAIALGIEAAVRKAQDPGQVQRHLERAGHAVVRAKEIIDGLLDFARAGGAVHDGSASAHLGDAIESVLAQVAPLAERVNARMIIEPFSSSICVACADGPLLSVLGNLVGNAVKYVGTSTPVRRVTLRVVDKSNVVRVEIEDTGPGIAPGVQKVIFDPYVRGPHAGQPGLGIGLATVKRIVEAHRGKVGVQSAVGLGSCFWFELPRMDVEVSEKRNEPAELH